MPLLMSVSCYWLDLPPRTGQPSLAQIIPKVTGSIMALSYGIV